MNDNYQVVVYGASGYTGRLVVEFLREYNIPFIAAGRNCSRIEEAMKTIPGIENADYKIVEVEHTVEALTALLKGKKVVCNTVGPFSRFGEETIQAALNSGCHYLDTTGEQNWMLEMEAKFHDKFEQAGLVCAPATAYMFSVSDIAARVCLETPGIDSLDVRVFTFGTPTVGSTQSVFDMCRNPSFKIVDHQLQQYEKTFVRQELALPYSGDIVMGNQWGGGSHVVYFKNDGRVRNCNMVLAMGNQNIWKGCEELEVAYNVQLQWLNDEQLFPVLDHLAGQMQSTMPPRENRHKNRFIDWCVGRGNNKSVRCEISGNNAYQITGLLQAYAAMRLIKDKPSKAGFRSINEVLGHRDVFGAIQAYGYATMKEQQETH
ncbi:DUF5938 domain-containing protein [Thalassotalea nanhaiensis]|uniref:DUF5938 domain-containing protein n=1 Tax=Thalassotalea nanhaiensis TaxID=3065648 RepID=A0ABY9TPA5_9GAMM|nr:DUF5938 domain-containing protein [Colwelliaceae bacterium SQ345]